jgi:hypothetical protein
MGRAARRLRERERHWPRVALVGVPAGGCCWGGVGIESGGGRRLPSSSWAGGAAPPSPIYLWTVLGVPRRIPSPRVPVLTRVLFTIG